MKLTQYMNESNVSAAQKSKKITDMIIGRLWKWLQRKNFIVSSDDLIDALNRISPRDIKFKLEHHRKNLGRYIGYAWFGASFSIRDLPDTGVELHITDKLADYLRRFAREDKKDMFFDRKKNMFYKELYELLSHELTHEMQALKSGMKIKWNWSEMDSDYLSDKGEIDAFALQAALQIIHSDKSQVWDIYSDFKSKGQITDKVYNRFMKKVTANIKELHRLGMTK